MVSMKKAINNDLGINRPPIPVIENSLAKINRNIEFHMEKKPESNANKVDIAVIAIFWCFCYLVVYLIYFFYCIHV